MNPATPDGTCYDLTPLLETWITAHCTIIIDESFLDFTNATSIATRIMDYEKLFVIKSLTKFYGCAGVRIGLIAGSEKMITALRQQEPAWKLSSWDMNYIGQALNNNQFIADTLTQTQQNRHDLKEILLASKHFCQVFDSDANFILAKLANLDGYQLQQKLKPYRILIRVCDNFDFLDASYVRLAVKKAEDILRLKTALESIQ
ncbi:L-threonine-O-3-phosphate decarboxylase [Beggiatoa sp. PS]|nr:L-threonine-O-3-phosphate decarboxylase [Beggiatoa sp. PS]